MVISVNKKIKCYLCIYDFYGPVRNAFDEGSIHYEGKLEGVGLGPGNETILGCVKWHRADWRVPVGAQKS
jgi:hypothetical protein